MYKGFLKELLLENQRLIPKIKLTKREITIISSRE